MEVEELLEEPGSWKEHWSLYENNPFYNQGQHVVKALSWLEYFRSLKQNTSEWLDAREEFQLTSSRVGAIMGLDPACSAAKVMASCQGQLFFDSDWSKRAKEWGHTHEPVAVRDLEAVTGIQFTETGLWPLKAFDYQLAGSPDRLGDDFVLEVKCPFSNVIPKQPKPKDVAQLFCNMACVGWKAGMLAYWTPAGMRYWMIDWNQETWDDVVHPQVQQFCRNLESKTPANKLRINSSIKSNNFKVLTDLVRKIKV